MGFNSGFKGLNKLSNTSLTKILTAQTRITRQWSGRPGNRGSILATVTLFLLYSVQTGSRIRQAPFSMGIGGSLIGRQGSGSEAEH